jgi:hypothetical protein
MQKMQASWFFYNAIKATLHKPQRTTKDALSNNPNSACNYKFGMKRTTIVIEKLLQVMNWNVMVRMTILD